MPDSERLDELTLRTPAFAGGRPIRLTDGQAWRFRHLPLDGQPGPESDDPSTISVELFTTLMLLRHAPDAFAAYERLFDVAAMLLQHGYWLTLDDCRTLMPFHPSLPEFVGRVRESEQHVTPWLVMVSAISDHVRPFLRELDRRHGPVRPQAIWPVV